MRLRSMGRKISGARVPCEISVPIISAQVSATSSGSKNWVMVISDRVGTCQPLTITRL